MKLTTRRLVRGALIAALYAVLCMAFFSISYGDVKFRISEALTVLPILMPEAIPGLFVVGNNQGGRFGAEYPMTAPGISHGIAFTLGRYAGEKAAQL